MATESAKRLFNPQIRAVGFRLIDLLIDWWNACRVVALVTHRSASAEKRRNEEKIRTDLWEIIRVIVHFTICYLSCRSENMKEVKLKSYWVFSYHGEPMGEEEREGERCIWRNIEILKKLCQCGLYIVQYIQAIFLAICARKYIAKNIATSHIYLNILNIERTM